jgi:predicted DNA-binding ribbon-helix-helix protein
VNLEKPLGGDELVMMKRSMILNGHTTSITLETGFYDGLKEIAAIENKTVTELVAEIDNQGITGNLSSAVRLFVLSHYMGGPLS